MYNDPGRKLQTTAYVLFVFETVVCLIVGGLCILDGYEQMITQGALIIIGGLIGAYVSNLLLYGFGELIMNLESAPVSMPDRTPVRTPVRTEKRSAQPVRTKRREPVYEESYDDSDDYDDAFSHLKW